MEQSVQQSVQHAEPRPRVAITGGTGLVGSALRAALPPGAVLVVTRRPAAPDQLGWDPARGELDAARLEGLDAVVHLAGENIAQGRWTAAKKRALVTSRVDATRLLAEKLARCARPPQALLAASAVGWYGDRGDEVLDETSARGSGFLAELCERWEAAAEPARAAGIRVAHLRMAPILSTKGGALPRIVKPFRLGLGGRLGSGAQWFPWVALGDVVAILQKALAEPAFAGAINVVAPQQVTNAEFTRTLARALHRPAVLPVPRFVLRVLFGEMAGALLASVRVVPRRLEQLGHRFELPDLRTALARILAEGR